MMSSRILLHDAMDERKNLKETVNRQLSKSNHTNIVSVCADESVAFEASFGVSLS